MRRFLRPAAGRDRTDRLLAILPEDDDYRGRLDRALDVVQARSTDRPDAYLYVAEPGGLRLPPRAHAGAAGGRPHPRSRRARSRRRWRAAPSGRCRRPPFEIPRLPEDDGPRVVTSTVGRLASFPVVAGGELLGLLRVGPVTGDEVPRAVADRLAGLGPALGVVLGQARREEELRQRLASASAQIEASSRSSRARPSTSQRLVAPAARPRAGRHPHRGRVRRRAHRGPRPRGPRRLRDARGLRRQHRPDARDGDLRLVRRRGRRAVPAHARGGGSGWASARCSPCR